MKNKKEFFGVLFSVLISVFLVGIVVYATTTIGNDVTVGDDLIVTEDVVLTGNDIGFANGASISNAADAELLTLTETLVSIVGKASVSSDFYVTGDTTMAGDLTLSGTDDDLLVTGDMVFGGGASIDNTTDAENLLITETLVIISGKASISGDLNIDGNDLTFGNGAAITNTDADTLTLTELLFDLNGSLDVSNGLIVGAGPLQVAHTASVAYSRFGTDTTGHSLAAADDLLITGLLEVDDAAYFDAAAYFGSTASITYTNDATGTGAEAALEVTVTDTSDISGNLNRGIYLNYTHQTDAMTGNSEVNGMGIDLSLQSDVPYAYAASLYTSSSGNPTVGFLAALSIYMDDPGSATGALVGIDIGLAGGSNSPSDRHTFIRMRNHTAAQQPESLIRVEGTPTADYLFSFEVAASSPVAYTNFCNTDGVNSDGSLKINVAGTTYYIPYYTVANCAE